MADPFYYDPYDTATGGTYPTSNDSTTSTSGSCSCITIPLWGGCSGDTTIYRVPVYTIRRILVKTPEKWSDEQALKYTNLINLGTKTGWKITMIINGNIIITDPNIETRSLKNFIPLLKERASKEDIEKINSFIEDNPI